MLRPNTSNTSWPRRLPLQKLCLCALTLSLPATLQTKSAAQDQQPFFGRRGASAQGDRLAPVWVQRQGTVTGGRGVTGYIQSEPKNVDSDPRRAYVLLSPGGRSYYARRRMMRADGTYQVAPLDKAAIPQTASAGLLVVLPAGDGQSDQAAVSFWTDAMRYVLKGRYYVAIATMPRYDSVKTMTWLTANTVKDVKDAQFSTESFVGDIVRDVSANYNIDPNRVFLHGAAESGLAAYACSLSDASPFKGFYIHDAPFRSAQLPSLTHARGRRYFLQQSVDDKSGPLWMAEAARKLLADKGASVKLASYQGSGAYNFPPDTRWEKMTEALTWLESGAQATKTK